MTKADKKTICCAYFLGLMCISLFAQVVPPEKGLLDQAFKDKNITAIQDALNAADTDEAKAALEAQVLAEARKLVLAGDFDNASKYAETVLLFDFLNTEAQDLFLSIEQQKTAAAELAARKKAEADALAQKQKDAEAQQMAIAAQAELQKKEEQKKQEETKFIESVQKVGLGNFSASAHLSPLAALVIYKSDFADAYNGTKLTQTGMPLSGGLGLAFNHPYVHAALRAQGSMTFVPLGKSEKLTDISALASIGTPLLQVPVCLAAGLTDYWFTENGAEGNNTYFVKKILSPTIGLSLDNLGIGKNLDFSASVLWLAGSTSNRNISSILTGDLSARFKFGASGKIRYFVSLGEFRVIWPFPARTVNGF